MVPKARFELARPQGQRSLSPPRLPFRHFGLSGSVASGSRGGGSALPAVRAAPQAEHHESGAIRGGETEADDHECVGDQLVNGHGTIPQDE